MERIVLIALLCALSIQQTPLDEIVLHPIDPLACPPNQIWNKELLQCTCTNLAKCSKGFAWNADSCTCVKQISIDPAPCTPRCPPKQVWNAELSQCTCTSIARCIFPYTWNENTCSCQRKLCPQKIACPANQQINYDTCRCECRRRTDLIPINKQWDEKLCKAVCVTVKQCSKPSFWNEDICDCDSKVCPMNIICNAGDILDYNTCKCVTDCKTPRNCGILGTWDTKKCSCVSLLKPVPSSSSEFIDPIISIDPIQNQPARILAIRSATRRAY